MYKISIGIPIYNMEKYLETAINSILEQTIGFENIEVILVDDCSSDKSGEICEKYSLLYKNIKYYRLEKNSGMAGKPRNKAIELATGEYMMFLDPDDYLLPDACEKMYKTIVVKNVMFVTANFIWKYIKEGTEKIHLKNESQMITFLEPQKALTMLTNSCCTKIVKREFILKNKLKFLEGMPSEDAYFTHSLFLCAKEGYYLNEPIFYYCIRNFGNLSETSNLNERFFTNLMNANRKIMEIFREEMQIRYYSYYYIDFFVYIVRKVLLSKQINTEQRIKIISEMRDLLSFSEKIKIDFNTESDKYEYLKIFKMKEEKEIENYVIKFEKIFEEIGIDEVKKIEREIIKELQEKIK